MKRFALFVFAGAFLCGAVGCVGDLLNPEDFIDGGTVIKSAEMVLAESCGTNDCHDDSPTPQAGLDLLSPNVESRVVDVNAIGLGGACQSDILVVAGDPDNSYLLDKILNAAGICGLQMPVVGSLSASDTEIIRQWIVDLGSSASGTQDGG